MKGGGSEIGRGIKEIERGKKEIEGGKRKREQIQYSLKCIISWRELRKLEVIFIFRLYDRHYSRLYLSE